MLASQRRSSEVARSRVPITNPPSMVHSAVKETTATGAGPAWPASSPSSLASPPPACCAERAGERSVVDTGRGRSVHRQHGPLRSGAGGAQCMVNVGHSGRGPGRSVHGQRGPLRSGAGALSAWSTWATPIGGRGRSVHGKRGPLRSGAGGAQCMVNTGLSGRGRSVHGQRGPLRLGALSAWSTRASPAGGAQCMVNVGHYGRGPGALRTWSTWAIPAGGRGARLVNADHCDAVNTGHSNAGRGGPWSTRAGAVRGQRALWHLELRCDLLLLT